MSADSNVECSRCGNSKVADFARCLREGWPMCCGYTMRLIHTAADIEHAVGEAMHEAMEGARHQLQLPGKHDADPDLPMP